MNHLSSRPSKYVSQAAGRFTSETAIGSAADMLSLPEPAIVARVPPQDVNRVIDDRIMPEAFLSHDDGRRVVEIACTLIPFYFDSATQLTSEERLLPFAGPDYVCTGSAPTPLPR